MQKQKKSCRGCAYFREDTVLAVLGPRWDMSLIGVGKTIGTPSVISTGSNCGKSNPSFSSQNVENNSCEEFLLKKQGMTLEQQLEEIKQQKILEEKNRLEKEKQIEYNKLSNRLKRNWYYVSALTIGLIGLLIAVWRFFLQI